MKCKNCGKEVEIRIGCRAVTIFCTACGKVFPIKDYLNEIDEKTWERISQRPANRA